MSRTGLCSCEIYPAGPLGPIAHDEVISRLVFSRQHIGSGGRIKPSVFSLTEIRTKGVSLVRTEKVGVTFLSRFANAVASMKADRVWFGLISFPASVAREIQIGAARAICLWEDPTPAEGLVPANEAHASLVANREIRDSDALEIRARLWLTEGGANKLAIVI